MSAWHGVGAAYAVSYAGLCAGTADSIASAVGRPISRGLLDVGSGTGTLAAVLADAGWIVTACEPELSMREIATAQHPHVAFVDAALPELPFADAAFGAVTANFVLNHVPDPRSAAREMKRVAAVDAVLVATIWTMSPSWFWSAVCERAGLIPATGERLSPALDFERTPEGFGRMLSDGGWNDVGVTDLTWTWQAGRDVLWEAVAGGIASAGAFYLTLDSGDQEKFRRAFDEICDEEVDDGFVALDHTAAIAVGRAG